MERPAVRPPARPAGTALLLLLLAPALSALSALSPGSAAHAPPGLPGGLAAQTPAASPSALGLGGHDVAAPGPLDAVAANPAGLGLADGHLAVAVLPVRASAGLAPVSLGDVGGWQGSAVPRGVRLEWLGRIERAGRETGVARVSVTPVAVARDGWAIHLSSVAAGRVRLNPDASELLLFGNAGRTGEPRVFELEGSRLDGWWISTVSLSRGEEVARIRGGRLAVGATASFVLGHAVAVARDVGTTLDGQPLEGDVRFPLISNPSTDDSGVHGRGLALDVGAAWAGERLDLGLAVRGLVHTFRWELGGLSYRPGTAVFDQETSDSDFDERPALAAPGVVRDAVRGMRFGPTVAAGAAWRTGPDERIVGSLGVDFGDDLVGTTPWWIGAGVETRPWRRVPVRGHVTAVEGGVRIGGGATLVLGRVRVGGSASLGVGGAAEGPAAGFALAWQGG